MSDQSFNFDLKLFSKCQFVNPQFCTLNQHLKIYEERANGAIAFLPLCQNHSERRTDTVRQRQETDEQVEQFTFSNDLCDKVLQVTAVLIYNKKFELMLTRRAKAYSSSCSQTVSLSPAISSQFILGVCGAAEDRKNQ